jgi:hypothetical protein
MKADGDSQTLRFRPQGVKIAIVNVTPVRRFGYERQTYGPEFFHCMARLIDGKIHIMEGNKSGRL